MNLKRHNQIIDQLNHKIVGKQYGSRASANRAIRNFCKTCPQDERLYLVNQLDFGCFEITLVKKSS